MASHPGRGGRGPTRSIGEATRPTQEPHLLKGWTCPECGLREGSLIGSRCAAPRCLVMHALRFRMRREGPRKLHGRAQIPEDPLEAVAHLEGRRGQALYRLAGVAARAGGLAGGQYRSYARREGHWWLCDDERVIPSPRPPPGGLDKGAYVLFCERAECKPELCLAEPPQWQEGEEGCG